MINRAPGTTSDGWDAYVEVYDRILAPFFRHYAADALRLAGVKRGDRILDVAAGPGTLTLLAARMGCEVVATDFAPAMIAQLRAHVATEHLTHVTAEVMDGQALALPPAAFDAAFSMFGLIFFPDRAAGFRELHRVLRAGGVAAVASWNRAPATTALAEAVKRALPARPASAPSPSGSLADLHVFESEMCAAGFVQVEVHSITHTWEPSTPELVWEFMSRNPVFTAFTEAERTAIHPALIDVLREELPRGPLRLESEARIGVGVK